MTDSTQRTFVGEDRRLLADDLGQAFEGIRRGARSGMVVLAAPTGWGKTRIVQEVYEQLSAESTYWPPSLAEPEASWLQARKRIFPVPFDVPAETAIPFLWLGISCQKDQMGRRSAALQYAEQQFQAHVGALAAALAGRGERWKTRLGAVGAVAGLFGLPDPVTLAMTWHGVATSTWGLLSQEWATFHGRKRESGARLIDTEGIGRESDRAVELAEQVALVSGEDLPIVLVIDDAHWADPGTVAFVDTLLTIPGHVLILSTAWPDQLAVQATTSGTFGEAMDRWTRAGVAWRHDLQRLSDTAVRSLVLEAAGQANEAMVDALCERADGNPNRLQGLLSLRVVRRTLAGSGQLTPGLIEDLPTGDREIYQAIWRELPESVREVLALSTVQGAEFNPDWIPVAARLLDLADADAGLAEARVPWGWVRSLDAALDAFVEAGLYERATEERDALFLPDELTSARASMLRWAAGQKQRDDWEELSTQAQRAILEAHYLGAEQGFLAIDGDVIDSAAQLIGHQSRAMESQRMLEVAERGIEWTHGRPEYADSLWRFRLYAADALGSLGRVHEALGRLDRTIEDGIEAARDVRSAGFLRVRWLREAGRYEEAITGSEVIVADWSRAFGGDHWLTLDARSEMARCLEAAGRVGEAITVHAAVLEDQERTLGPDHPDSLTTRNDLASALTAVGRAGRALEVLERLAEDEISRRGAEHPSVLSIRANIAACLGNLHRWDEAVKLNDEVLEAMRRVLGADHPRTLETRHHLCLALSFLGREEEALAGHRLLLGDRERILGPDHPDTLVSRHYVASTLAMVGDLDGAIPLLEAVVADRVRVLGIDHALTMLSYSELGVCYRGVGQEAEGEEAQQRVLAYRTRALGDDHPDTLETRLLLAGAHVKVAALAGDAEGVAAGLTELEELIADQARALEAGHPLVVKTRDFHEFLKSR